MELIYYVLLLKELVFQDSPIYSNKHLILLSCCLNQTCNYVDIVTWPTVTLVSFLGPVLLRGMLAVLTKDFRVPPGFGIVRVFSTFKSRSSIWGKTIFNCHFITEILETDVFRTFPQWCWEQDASWMVEVKGGNERALCCGSWMPRVAAAKRSNSLVSDYSSAPRRNGALHCLLPDLVHLGMSLPAVSMECSFCCWERVLLWLSSECRVRGPFVSPREGTVYMPLCLILQWCARG